MCGITGGCWLNEHDDIVNLIGISLYSMENRGPDSQGVHVVKNSKNTIAFGHNRLAIIDLSLAGIQPMSSVDNRYIITFNGEIYNYQEIRDELLKLGVNFNTRTDTEVLLNAWIYWEKECLTKIIGMFAFSIYDRVSNEIVCVRDAFGIKPLFYMINEDKFIFSSIQQALWVLSEDNPKPNLQRCYDYLVPGDYDSQESTFIEDVYQLRPASMIRYNINTGVLSSPEIWWNPVVEQTSKMSFSQAVEAVRNIFLDNVRLHMRSDVPIGAALSGGVDSSALVCAMRFLEPKSEIHTFSFIDKDNTISEHKWVDIVNHHINAIPHKVTIDDSDIVSDIDDLILTQGEPFGGTSVYGQYRVFQLAKKEGIIVTLDGQGADELFAGYDGFPGFRLLSFIESNSPFKALKFLHKWSQWSGRTHLGGFKKFLALYFPQVLCCDEGNWMGCNPLPSWIDADELSLLGVSTHRYKIVLRKEEAKRRVVGEMKYSLTKKGLVSLLRHADRDSMNFSVESRVPFLTIPLAELVLTLPEDYLIGDNGETKKVFKAAMRGIVPDEILDRRDKVGFATPESRWIIVNVKYIRECLELSKNISFIQTDNLIHLFNKVTGSNGKYTISWQVWCWINFIKWFSWMNNYKIPKIHSLDDSAKTTIKIEYN